MHSAIDEVLRLRRWIAPLADFEQSFLEVQTYRDQVEIAPAGAGILRCKSLRYRTADYDRLAPTDVDGRAEDAIAIVGDASARMAFAQLVLGLTQPSEGEVTIDGINPAEVPETRRRSLVAGVLSGAEPVGGTIIDSFRLIDPACGRSAVLDACAQVGLREWMAALPLGELTPLSRSALAGAVSPLLCLAGLLLRLPRVLVLDGTLDQLDTARAQALARFAAVLPCTVVLCTARPDIIPPNFRPVSVFTKRPD